MKDITKNRLKKIGKIGAYCLGIAFALCAGLVMGKCSADAVNKKEQTSLSSKKLMPKFALNPDNNLLNNATLYDGVRVDVGSGNGNVYSLSGWNTWVIYRSFLPEGAQYVLTYDGDIGAYATASVSFINGVANAVVERIESHSSWEFDSSLIKPVTINSNDLLAPTFFSLPSGFYVTNLQGGSNIVNVAISLPVGATGLYLADDSYFTENYDGGVYFDLPTSNWYPYQIFGANNSPVIRGPVHNTMDNVEKRMEDLLFICNGKLYSGISFFFTPVAQAGSTGAQQGYPAGYGYFNQDNSVVWAQTCQSDDLWYLSQVSYREFDSSRWIPVGGQRTKVYTDYSQSVTQYFDWISDAYSRFQVIRWSDSVNSSITTSELSSFDWLKTIAESSFDATVNIGGDSINVFTIFQQGFESVSGILGMQILPYLSLGTLLLAPLVIILALAILRILNK